VEVPDGVAVPKLLLVPLAVPDAVPVVLRVAPELPERPPADFVAELLPLARPLLEAVPDADPLLVAVGEAEPLAMDEPDAVGEPEAALLPVPLLVLDAEGAVENVAVPKLLLVPLAVPDAVPVVLRVAPELPERPADFVAVLLLLAQKEARPLLEAVPEDEPDAVLLAVLLAVPVAVRLLEALSLPSPHATSRKIKVVP
jgi:hypothetical protein